MERRKKKMEGDTRSHERRDEGRSEKYVDAKKKVENDKTRVKTRQGKIREGKGRRGIVRDGMGHDNP